LLGATGTGKTAVMSWVFEELQRPALVLAGIQNFGVTVV
jgi:excinuclease UvrABC helicase subunit UvrB